MRKLIGRTLAWFIRAAYPVMRVRTDIGMVAVGDFVDETVFTITNMGDEIDSLKGDLVNLQQEILLAHQYIEKLRAKRDARGRFVKGGEE